MSTAQHQALKPMQALIVGRVEAVRTHEGVRYTRVLSPAPDSYSRPQTFEIRSKQPLGPKGDEIKVVCQLGGYTRKSFEMKDKATGEIIKITPVDHTFDAVE